MAELLTCDDYSFVQRAYWVLLSREPDPGGLANYLERLRAGTPKLQVLSELARSPEGRAKGGEPDRVDPVVEVPAPTPTSTRMRAADTWGQLVANQGQAFIACAYQTLLGRDPDPYGLRGYLDELRNGVSKIQVLAQLRHSKECKSRLAGVQSSSDHRKMLRRLDWEIWKFRLARVPLIGWLLKAAFGIEGNGSMEMRLRRIEYLLMSSRPEEIIIFPETHEADAPLVQFGGEVKHEPPREPVTRQAARDDTHASLQTTTANAASLRSLPMPSNWAKETQHG